MPKRMIDFDALWASVKLSRCRPAIRFEYLWLFGLADSGGSFELTNLRVIWGKVAPIRPDLTMRKLRNALKEFQKCGLLFTWKQNGRIFGHWVGSLKPGRLPPPSQRSRYEVLAPQPPTDLLVKYETGFNSRRDLDSNPNGVGLGGVGSGSEGRERIGLERPQNARPVSHLICYEPAKPKQPTPQQVEYSKVAKLIPGAVEIVLRAKAMNKIYQSADCREELKEWAAKRNLDYDSTSVSKALDVAEGKTKQVAAET